MSRWILSVIISAATVSILVTVMAALEKVGVGIKEMLLVGAFMVLTVMVYEFWLRKR